jgi:hypothetical protein
MYACVYTRHTRGMYVFYTYTYACKTFFFESSSQTRKTLCFWQDHHHEGGHVCSCQLVHACRYRSTNLYIHACFWQASCKRHDQEDTHAFVSKSMFFWQVASECRGQADLSCREQEDLQLSIDTSQASPQKHPEESMNDSVLEQTSTLSDSSSREECMLLQSELDQSNIKVNALMARENEWTGLLRECEVKIIEMENLRIANEEAVAEKNKHIELLEALVLQQNAGKGDGEKDVGGHVLDSETALVHVELRKELTAAKEELEKWKIEAVQGLSATQEAEEKIGLWKRQAKDAQDEADLLRDKIQALQTEVDAERREAHAAKETVEKLMQELFVWKEHAERMQSDAQAPVNSKGRDDGEGSRSDPATLKARLHYAETEVCFFLCVCVCVGICVHFWL